MPQYAGEPIADGALEPEGPGAIAPAGETEAVPQDAGEPIADDAPDRRAEHYISPRPILRANIRRALLLKGQERRTLLQRLVTQADDLLSANSYDVDALYTKAEALLALQSYARVDELLAALPQYVAERPDFQAMQARVRMAQLIAARPQPFDPSIVQSVVDSWNTAGKSSVELRSVATIARLRATAAMVDGATLQELQESATANFSRLMSRQPESDHNHNTAKLSAWWLTAVRHAVTADSADENVSYAEIAPQLEQHASFLDTLDGELVSASRYVYAPK